MAATPEVLKPEPEISERKEEFIVDETLKNAGVRVVQKNFTAQVKNDKGQPIIETPPEQVVTVTPPYPEATLKTQAKGPTTSSLTWLATFWVRIIKKALHFGWRVIGE